MASYDPEDLEKALGLSWNDSEYGLSEFLDSFTLPQIIQVTEGVYGESEEATLSSGQILTMHVVKSIRMFRGYTYEGREVLVPLNCPQKVEVRPQNVSLLYDTVKELCSVFPGVHYVRVTKDHVDPAGEERCLRAGQKLKLDYITNDFAPRMMCLDEEGCEVCLSMDVQGGFQPLADNKEYFLAELDRHIALPVYVQFTSPPTFIAGTESATKADSALLTGMFQIDEAVIESIVIASSREDGRKTILTFPRTLDISLVVPEQAMVKDSTYARFCKSLNDGVDLVKVQSVVVPEDQVIYGSNRQDRTQLIREFSFTVAKFGDQSSTRQDAAEKNVTTSQKDDDDTSSNEEEHDYEYIDIGDYGDVVKKTRPPVSAKPKGVIARLISKRTKSVNPVTTPAKKTPKQTDIDDSLSREGESINDPTDAEEDSESEDDEGYTIPIHPSRISSVCDMTVTGVAELLQSLNLGQYVEQFQLEQVDGKMLKDLDKEILVTHFSMTSFHALKLGKAVEENWRDRKSVV